MFRKNKSFRSSKDVTTVAEAAAPVQTLIPDKAPVAAPSPVVEKPEPKKAVVPAGPSSIVPPGTKRVLVVGKYVVMTADVENCDAVVVQGNLDGNIKAKYIVIMKGGCMRGKLECKEADVAGSFEGVELIAHHRLTLSATARVGGKMTYNRLSVHDGAIVTGELLYKPSSKEKPAPAAPTTSTEPVIDTSVENTADHEEEQDETTTGVAPPTDIPAHMPAQKVAANGEQ